MKKSRAEIQKAYRQRLKQKNQEEYQRKERERMRRSYVPSSALSENDRNRRNTLNREKLRRFYQRKRELRLANLSVDQETSGYDTDQAGPSQERGRLRVRLNFRNNRREGALRRWKRELSEAKSRVRLLEQERDSILKKCRSTQRALQRMKQSKEPDELTPRKQTVKMMDEANLSTNQREKIKKTLLLGNVMVSEVKATKEKTSKGLVKAIHRTVSGRIVKKYRCFKLLASKTGLCRHRLAKSDSKTHQIGKSSRVSIVKRHQSQVEMFLKREDNSRMQPGKNDVKRLKKGEKFQTYILTDYLSNLYNKFKSENPMMKISFTSFCRSRPKYILTAAFSSRSACLCTKHQNAALTVKVLKRVGVDIPANPEKVLQQMPAVELMRENLDETVVMGQWTRIEVEEKGKKKYVTKIVESKLDKAKFLTHFETQMKDFEAHVTRVSAQYEQIRVLKEKLPKHEMIVQLDFAENYSCKSLEEVQSAYFNQTSVTLHPMVAYYRSSDGSLQHKSFIIVSDEMRHRSSTVMTFIDEIIPALKEIDGQLRTIHYWSDSPTSQYRNKHIFDMVANHVDIYGIKARWNFFEAGHGKGPCDGLGGTCKRLADEAMRSGKVIIQDATAFYEWAIQSSMTNVTFRFVSTSKCEEAEKAQELRRVKPIKGTMKIHAVVGMGESQIKVRDTSCYCSICLSGNTCDSWRNDNTRANNKTIEKNTENTEISLSNRPTETASAVSSDPKIDIPADTCNDGDHINQTVQCEAGDFVAAVYDGQWYIGKVSDKDEIEYEIEIDFMESKKQLFQWPRMQDTLWLKQNAVLCKIDSPEPTGKSQRMYRMSENDKEKVIKLFAEYMQ